jgi:23S rRNA (guanosine2251-2'-O)-methyltransferase
LYGINPIARALAVGRRKLFRLWLREGRLSDALAALHTAMAAHGLPIAEAPVADLGLLAGSDSHQGAVLECGPLPLGSEEQALDVLGPELAAGGVPAPLPEGAAWPLLVVLDQVEDPQNFGAIVRSCAVFGASGVVVPRHHTAPPSPAASKASAGELEAFPVFEAANLSRFLEACKARGAWTAAAVTEGGDPLASFKRDTPLVLVVGNEGRGLRPLVERHCDFRLTIPVRPGTSLNVSAATAVLLYGLTTTGTLPRPGILAPPPRPDKDRTEVV